MAIRNSKSIFVTFGAGRSGWIGAAKRITAEAEETELFEFCFNLDERWLETWDPEIYKIGFNLRKTHPPRGFGYWTWKPSVLLWTHLNFPNHQIVYVDAGSQIYATKDARDKLTQLLTKADKLGQLAWFSPNHPEIVWTKTEVLRKFNLSRGSKLSPQVQSGFIVLASTPLRETFITEFRDFALKDGGFYFSDILSEIQEESFIEHRHDQSVLSCIWKSSSFYMEADPSFPSKYNLNPIVSFRNNSRLALQSPKIFRIILKYLYLVIDHVMGRKG